MSRLGLNISFASKINEETIEAYLSTLYIVYGVDGLTLKIGVPNVELQAIYNQYNFESAAFVTAYNPFSQITCDDANQIRQMQLREEIEKQGSIFFNAVGEHPSGSWPGEPSFFILGLSISDAKLIGNRYEQNAIVWCDERAVPNLVLLR